MLVRVWYDQIPTLLPREQYWQHLHVEGALSCLKNITVISALANFSRPARSGFASHRALCMTDPSPGVKSEEAWVHFPRNSGPDSQHGLPRTTCRA